MYILTANEIRKVEQNCFEKYYNESELMLKAGTACYEQIIKKYSSSIKNATVNVFCGNGKNAGDGFVIARLLNDFGANAKIIICDKMPTIDEPLMYYNQAVSAGVEVENFGEKSTDADFVVDCMFGIGFHGEARAPFDKIFEKLRQSNATIISVDTPSGTNATTGEICKNAVMADFTIAISTLKYAHVLPPANECCGESVVVDISIPKECYGNDYAKTIDFEDVKSSFKPRSKNSNKGTFGHQLNLCGSYKMPGAGVIVAKSAIRCGAGLVKCTMPKSAYHLMASHLIQPIFNPVEENQQGTYSANALDEILTDLQWANSVVIGCGMGVNDDTKSIVKAVIKNINVPFILDADGINCINSCIDIIKDIEVPSILTPHPGEMARLISKTTSYVQQNRIECAKQFARDYNTVLVLKGANTVVTDGKEVFVNTNGNPALAMGGTGDMLSGMIGAFVAQGMGAFEAARAGVFIHGLCSDVTAEKISKRGMLVSDMIDQLGILMSEFE